MGACILKAKEKAKVEKNLMSCAVMVRFYGACDNTRDVRLSGGYPFLDTAEFLYFFANICNGCARRKTRTLCRVYRYVGIRRWDARDDSLHGFAGVESLLH